MSIITPQTVKTAPSRLLQANNAALFIVDVQERFAPVISDFAAMVKHIRILTETATQLQIPVIVSEQYKKGLGETVPEIVEVLPSGSKRFEKTVFGSLGDQTIADHLAVLNRPQVILCGLEAHVCVSQTAHQLLAKGYQVHLIQEAITSRTKENRSVGLEKMQQSGAIPSSIEMALFELLQDAKHPQFKAVQSFIK